MIKIFDSQMNVGKDIFGPNSNIEDYLNGAYENGVIKAIMIPTGTHELKLTDGTVERSCIWHKNNDKIVFKRIILDEKGNTLEEQTDPQNPYSSMNLFCYNLLKEQNMKQKNINFYFCPKLHPTLDTPEEVIKYLDLREVVAFKIQGISSYTSPKKIPLWLVDVLKESDKPLIVHTDYRYKKIGDGLDEIVKDNDPLEWAKWATKNELRCYFAHGLRLDNEAIDIVNNSELFVVGLGPDLMLNQEKNSLCIGDVDYLDYLFNKVKSEKICFNYDYRWNVHRRGEWDNLDWDSPKRVIEYAQKLGFNENDLDNIFFYNAMRFFDIDEEK